MPKLTRRNLLAAAPGIAAPFVFQRARAMAAAYPEQRITLAQVPTRRNVEANMEYAREAFEVAAEDKAGWIMFPEMFLSGYYGEFEQSQVAAAFDQVRSMCRRAKVRGLIGTGWKQDGRTYNQIRIVNRSGDVVSAYAKTCLCYGEDEWTDRADLPLVHELDGLKFGTLICNDLWVTPGFTDGPNPHLTLKIAKQGAQVIFHAINSGADQRYRAYHESNLLLRAAEAKCPIVTCNGYTEPMVNALSGVVGSDHAFEVELPREKSVIRTVAFTPAPRA